MRREAEVLEVLTPKQRAMYEKVKQVYKNQPNVYLSLSELKSLIDCDLEARDSLLSDFVYSTVNKEDNPVKFMITKGRGKYRFVGTNYKPAQPVEVTWDMRLAESRKFVVGTYSDCKYSWDFTVVKAYLNGVWE